MICIHVNQKTPDAGRCDCLQSCHCHALSGGTCPPFQSPPPKQVALSDFNPPPVPMLLTCPVCHVRHIDRGPFATKPHHTHACQSCGIVWRPALIATVGVAFLPGFKDEP